MEREGKREGREGESTNGKEGQDGKNMLRACPTPRSNNKRYQCHKEERKDKMENTHTDSLQENLVLLTVYHHRINSFMGRCGLQGGWRRRRRVNARGTTNEEQHKVRKQLILDS